MGSTNCKKWINEKTFKVLQADLRQHTRIN